MEIIGTFTSYTPDASTLPEDMPEEMKRRVLFLQNENGDDWYSLVKVLPRGFTYIGIHGDDMIGTADNDPERMFPQSLTLIRLDQKFENPESLRGQYLNRETGMPEKRTPQVTKVSAAQAALALDDSDLCEKLGIVPDPGGKTLYERVEEIASVHPVRQVRIWFLRANDWYLSNPYIWGIAAELNLSDEQVLALFNAAINY